MEKFTFLLLSEAEILQWNFNDACNEIYRDNLHKSRTFVVSLQ